MDDPITVPARSNSAQPIEVQVARGEVLTEGFKGLLLVNGGAIAALLAFLQAVWEKFPILVKPTLTSIGFMAAGLAVSLLIPIFRSFHSKKHHNMSPEEQEKDPLTGYQITYRVFFFLSVVLFVSGVGSFVFVAWRLAPEGQPNPALQRPVAL